MPKIKDLGNFEVLPEIAAHIYEGNVDALQAALAAGWDLEKEIVLSQYTTVSPMELALMAEKLEVVKLLVEHGANLNAKEKPAFLLAVRYCKENIVRYIAEQGARMDMLNRVKSGAYEQAYYGQKSNIPLIHELGLDIRQHAGEVLRNAAADNDRKTIDYLLEHGVDINYNQPDMVYPYKATPLTVATRMGNVGMVKYLVERGADVTLAEKGGERPYTIAVSNKQDELAAYLKSLEPAELHDLENRKYELQKHKLSPELIAFLTGDNLHVKLADNDFEIKYIDFLSLTDTVEMKIGRKKLLRISACVDNYSGLVLVWNPQKKGMIGCYDEEHQEYADLASFAEFMKRPEVYLMKFMEGELGE
ncbi:ankyrin repeat domain-containing protein [Brevibacillus parabrevis]|jgi:FOG: Ankyrin repeat|uniref:ankyrin repeat domain-containing protein n=1 Tax=Brevibacillus parabrevis TaxID=54914 RepID=UPI002491225F|nr:ankyrin repeat domain-containing protein [Brevibacillus parabrevis]